jgi:ferredoxin
MCAGQPTCAEVCPEGCLDFVNVIPGRFYAMNPEHLAEILYSRMYKIRRDL